MQALQAELAGTDARLVSITVDPAHDSPEVLRAYADSYDADPARWLFLTGSEEAVDALVRGGFKMAVDRAGADDAPAGQRVTHDTRLVAVDARGRIRGWYDGRSEAGLRALGARMHYLAGEGRAEPAGGAARR
jgi:cytochrome oxidase Cu insertion factor (SCO1/SenC/PrrC family)